MKKLETMKTLPIIILLSFISMFSFSQQKTELGISAEGSWFMPYRTGSREWSTKNGFGTGLGIYASHNLFWRVSADVGLAYRYKQMQQHYVIYSENLEIDPYTGYLSQPEEGWDKLPMHYVVVPIHLQVLLSKSFFIRGGIESTWLINYDVVNEKPEFNWSVGFGSQKNKLKWSVNYIKGFREQGFGDYSSGTEDHYIGSINRNNMLQLQLSFPIGELKY